MWIRKISLGNFRNYQSLVVELNPGFNIFVGNNAQGKTNLLESMYLLALSKSYRAGRDKELINHDQDQLLVQGRINRAGDVDLKIKIGVDTSKQLMVNNKPTTANRFVGKLNVVLFTPDTLQLIKGSPG